MNFDDIKLSTIEGLVINWATPFDAAIRLFSHEEDPRVQKYIDKYGLIRGIFKIKNRDYRRLIFSQKNNTEIPEEIYKLYENTSCGSVMVWAYNLFR